MPSKIDPHERETTQHLIDDFGVDSTVTVERVYKESWKKFSELESDSSHLVEIYNNVFFGSNRQLVSLPKVIHQHIYKGLFSNAGEYRLSSDPFQGRVHFGPQHGQQRRPKFQGASPHDIEEQVKAAFSYFNTSGISHLMRCIYFYEKFVYIHPFYDGNGRIGRLIANIYLAGQELTLLWSEFDSKGKFIKKLNWCHDSRSAKAFNTLEKYMRNYLYSFDQLDEDFEC